MNNPPQPPSDTPNAPAANNASAAGQVPTDEVKNASEADVARFITTIKDVDRQVGEHVIRALQHNDTVAVLTTVVVGPGGEQHIVSAALNPSQTAEVNRLLQTAEAEREDEEMCVGFHCLIKPKGGQQS